MPYETLGDFIVPSIESADYHLFKARQEIKILFYTDYPSISLNDSDTLGVSHLESLMKSHQPAFATVSITLRNRNALGHASLKLDAALQEQDYDELWLFGYYQANTNSFVVNLGGPQNELDATELSALEEWMKTGGLLITGDHSNADVRPGVNDPGDHSTYIGLGNALGNRVPRAGQLRIWKGPPTSFNNESRNTQVAARGENPNDDTLQFDKIPQSLDLISFPPLGLPHPLFLGSNWNLIRVFPDHNHEGEVKIPKTLNNEWGNAKEQTWKPEPIIIAKGKDKRLQPPQEVAILAAYDGDPVPAGRIVADSTWHHYFNLNLMGFVSMGEGAVSDLLGQFYSNLALWLAPLKKRQDMACAMFWWLANHPVVLEEPYDEVLSMGDASRGILSKEATDCEIHELLQVHIPMEFRPQGEMIYFPTQKSGDESLLTQEAAFGHIVTLYRRATAAIAYADSSSPLRTVTAEDLIATGYRNLFRFSADRLED